MKHNIILDTDSYKASHFLQYPPGTKFVSSYIEPRGVDKDFFWEDKHRRVVNFGLQYFLKKYLSLPINKHDIDQAQEYFIDHGVPFNREGWDYILETYGGYLPVSIQALPEGTLFPLQCCQVQVRNRDPKLPWLASYLETSMLRAIWYPSTVATLSRQIKLVIKRYMELTSDSLDGLDFKLHDFGARGVSSLESAEIGGLAHLVNFRGSDTMSAIVAARRYYSEPMAGFSIPAAEHSTITSWNREQECAAYANMIEKFSRPGSLYAVVSDSYDIFNAVENLWGGKLKERVVNSGGTLVIRPDSGDPVKILDQVFKILGNKFEYRVNKKGFKVLPPYLRVIQGDGVNFESITTILEMLKLNGWSAENIAFGMGGALLQKVNRDTLKYAMKASAAYVREPTCGVWRDVYKDPVTDKGKSSKKGILAVLRCPVTGVLFTSRESELTLSGNMQRNELETVFLDGEILRNYTLEEIRETAKV